MSAAERVLTLRELNHATLDRQMLLGRSLSGSEDPRELVFRYLAAFGPATVRDVQTWSGRTQLKQPIEEIKPELRTSSKTRAGKQVSFLFADWLTC